jgi:hypothetical protein
MKFNASILALWLTVGLLSAQTTQPPATTAQATNMVANGVYISPSTLGDFYTAIVVPNLGGSGFATNYTGALNLTNSANVFGGNVVTYTYGTDTNTLILTSSDSFVAGEYVFDGTSLVNQTSPFYTIYRNSLKDNNSIEVTHTTNTLLQGWQCCVTSAKFLVTTNITAPTANATFKSVSGDGSALTGYAPSLSVANTDFADTANTDFDTFFGYSQVAGTAGQYLVSNGAGRGVWTSGLNASQLTSGSVPAGVLNNGTTNTLGWLETTNGGFHQRSYNAGNLTNLDATMLTGLVPEAALPNPLFTNTTTVRYIWTNSVTGAYQAHVPGLGTVWGNVQSNSTVMVSGGNGVHIGATNSVGASNLVVEGTSILKGLVTGNGGGLTNLNAANIVGNTNFFFSATTNQNDGGKVRYISASGSDSNNGLSAATGWLTPSNMVSLVNAVTNASKFTLYIGSGSYSWSLGLGLFSTAGGSPTTYVYFSTNVVVNCLAPASGIESANTSTMFAYLNGAEFYGTNTISENGIGGNNASKIYVYGVSSTGKKAIFSGFDDGLSTHSTSSPYAYVSDCIFTNCTKAAMDSIDTSWGLVERCDFYGRTNATIGVLRNDATAPYTFNDCQMFPATNNQVIGFAGQTFNRCVIGSTNYYASVTMNAVSYNITDCYLNIDGDGIGTSTWDGCYGTVRRRMRGTTNDITVIRNCVFSGSSLLNSFYYNNFYQTNTFEPSLVTISNSIFVGYTNVFDLTGSSPSIVTNLFNARFSMNSICSSSNNSFSQNGVILPVNFNTNNPILGSHSDTLVSNWWTAGSSPVRSSSLNGGNIGLPRSTSSKVIVNSLSGANVFAQVYATDTITATNGFASYASNMVAPSSITFPATTVNWTNTFGKNIFVFIDNAGVTGTVIKINGTQIASTLMTTGVATIPLQPNEFFSETYTIGTPTATWKPQ